MTNKKRLAAVLMLIVLSGGAGFYLGSQDHAEPVRTVDDDKPGVWTCSMHPQIKLPKRGLCPICHMDLIPLTSGTAPDRPAREISISAHAARLAEIETRPVRKKFVTVTVRMTGKIAYDETRLAYITAWVGGRIDRMYVDYTGVAVKKGDHMVELYSPDVLVAGEELILARKAVERYGDGAETALAASAAARLATAREKLRLWGLLEEQIDEIEKRGAASDHVTIYAPVSGVVIARSALQGQYVTTGTAIYAMADLNRLWVNIEAYESDLKWLRYGQKVSFGVEAYPGEKFTGTISFIHPTVNEATRTVAVRVNTENPDGRLKPGMFVRATVDAGIGSGGRVIDPALAGKWISPMHPEIVKDAPGDCDVCGMPLVRAEDLGYRTAREDGDAALVVPATAPLITGTRAVVYVKVPGAHRPTFVGREVVLGPRAGGYYVVAQGLAEGEEVVVRGNFKLDSALQIEARPSMMTPEHADAPTDDADTAPGPQRTCPVMGGVIDRKVFVDYAGLRIYFCCPGCEKTFLADPAGYLKKLAARGERPEKSPAPETAAGKERHEHRH